MNRFHEILGIVSTAVLHVLQFIRRLLSREQMKHSTLDKAKAKEETKDVEENR